MKNENVQINRKKRNIIYIIVFFAAIYVVYFFIQLISNPVNNITVVNGKISQEQNLQAYVIRDEELLTTNQVSDINLSLSEGSRVAKGQIIGSYANENRKQWEQKIKELDIKIQDAMEQQSNIYSSDIRKLESQIEEKINLINNTNQMQLISQYKSEIDNLLQKKAKISGELSPSGSTIKQLIEERNGYETKLNESNDYVRSTKAGVISNRIDGLENILTVDKLYDITYENLESYKIRTDEIVQSDTKSAKVIDNYYCYLVLSITDEHKENIQAGDYLKVRLNYGTIETITALVDKVIEEGENKTIFLKITQNVESLIGYRKISLDIIWWEDEGLKVPNKAIKTEEYKKINKEDGSTSIENRYYVNLLKYGIEYKVYVKVINSNEDYTIIENITKDDIEALGLTQEDIVKEIIIYDKLVI